MKVCVFGLWHLGSVTAACLAAAGFDVLGLDDDSKTVDGLSSGKAPLFEPGLDAVIQDRLNAGSLRFTTVYAQAGETDILWVAFDTPIDDEDHADVEFVKERVRRIIPTLKDGAIILVSSQMPVGSIAELERDAQRMRPRGHISFACSPENLRLGTAIEAFHKQARIVVGTRREKDRAQLATLFAPFCDNLIWVSVESAEMTKHALNAFLGLSVTFINEIATICERVGADAAEVEAALRSEPRIGPKAYLRPGTAFAGGTLARDITFLTEIAKARDLIVPVLSGVVPSNRVHRAWPLRRVLASIGEDVKGATIAVLGLSYKPGTDALRRSVALEIIQGLLDAGIRVRAFDPVVKALPAAFDAVTLCANAEDAVQGAKALVIATDWPDFKTLSPELAGVSGELLIVIDQNRTLPASFRKDPRIRYVTLGQSQ